MARHTYLRVREPDQPERLVVWDTQDITLGRAPENDLHFADDEMSRRHAVLAKAKGGFEIADYNTSNGTHVNGERVGQKLLKPGDTITFGAVELVFEQTDEHPATLGAKVLYASQLKQFGFGAGEAGNAGATMLGGMEMLAEGADAFVIEPEAKSGDDAFSTAPAADFQLELEDEDGLNEMEPVLEFDEPTPAIDPAPARPAPRAAGPESAAPATNPDEQTAGGDPASRLRQLKMLRDEDLITDEEFQRKRAEILARM